MISKEFLEQLIQYMKDERTLTIKEKCKKIGISVQTYYKACKKYNLSGKIGPKMPNFDETRALKIIKDNRKVLDTSECTPFLGDL